MANKVFWVLMVAFAILVRLYPAIYFIIDRTFGLLRSKPDALLLDMFWNIGFYTHIILGGLALLIGWMQFSLKFRNRNIKMHRRVGMVYIVAVVLSSLAGIYIALFATGGLPTSLGFLSLGAIWLGTTMKAYTDIRKGEIEQHRRMMIYSYAACFSAVTLRIWLPILIAIFGDFIIAYTIVAWVCWIPNLFVAYLIVKNMQPYQSATYAPAIDQ